MDNQCLQPKKEEDNQCLIGTANKSLLAVDVKGKKKGSNVGPKK